MALKQVRASHLKIGRRAGGGNRLGQFDADSICRFSVVPAPVANLRYRPREDLMRIPGKKFALVSAPLLVAGVMLGVPLAGSAHALERQPNCGALRQVASDYYAEGALDFYDANQALAAGAWIDYLYYSYLEAQADRNGDDASTYATSRGC
jgi:hypothetical protein